MFFKQSIYNRQNNIMFIAFKQFNDKVQKYVLSSLLKY